MGFVVESENVEVYVCGKLVNKGLDMIVVNDIIVEGLGFNSDNNVLYVIWNDGDKYLFVISKVELVKGLVSLIV